MKPSIVFFLFVIMYTNYVFTNIYCCENKQMSDNKNICEISKNVRSNYSLISKNAKEIVLTKEENCLLMIMDSLVSISIASNKKQALIALDSIAKYSDGYVSEHFVSIVPEMFYGNFRFFTEYLYNNQNNYLQPFLIDGLGMEISMSEDRKWRMKKIEEFVKHCLSNYKYSEQYKKYIKKILKGIKPDKWD